MTALLSAVLRALDICEYTAALDILADEPDRARHGAADLVAAMNRDAAQMLAAAIARA